MVESTLQICICCIFSISFVNQAELGEVLTFLVGEFDGVYYVRSLRKDGKVNVEARIKLENL